MSNRQIDNCIERIANDLNNLGINNGDIILVHSSFKSLGHVDGGIETVIQGLLKALGKSGTLLLPALSWRLRPPEVFNPATTPTNVGAIPEYFRTHPGTKRSIHPTHSVCAVGSMANELLYNCELDHTPCGPNSPFNKITELNNAKIVMLGCGAYPNTTMHAIEEIAKVPYHNGKTELFSIINHAGELYQQEYRMYDFIGKYIQRYDRVLELPDSSSFTTKGKVLEADTLVFNAKKLKKVALEKLKQDLLFFVDRNMVSK